MTKQIRLKLRCAPLSCRAYALANGPQLLEQVNAALRKHLKPENFVYGFGGDFKD